MNLAIDNGVGALLRSFTGFLVGGCLAKIYVQTDRHKINWDWVFVFTCFVLALELIFHHEIKKIPFGLLLFPLPLLVFSLSCSQLFIKNFFSHKIIIYLGHLSFGIYMLHQPILRIMRYFLYKYYEAISFVDAQILLLFNLLICLIIIILSSAFTYHLIEKPFQNILRKKISL